MRNVLNTLWLVKYLSIKLFDNKINLQCKPLFIEFDFYIYHFLSYFTWFIIYTLSSSFKYRLFLSKLIMIRMTYPWEYDASYQPKLKEALPLLAKQVRIFTNAFPYTVGRNIPIYAIVPALPSDLYRGMVRYGDTVWSKYVGTSSTMAPIWWIEDVLFFVRIQTLGSHSSRTIAKAYYCDGAMFCHQANPVSV